MKNTIIKIVEFMESTKLDDIEAKIGLTVFRVHRVLDGYSYEWSDQSETLVEPRGKGIIKRGWVVDGT